MTEGKNEAKEIDNSWVLAWNLWIKSKAFKIGLREVILKGLLGFSPFSREKQLGKE